MVFSQCSALCKIFLSCVSEFSGPTIVSITEVLIQLNRTMLWAIGVLSFSLKVNKNNYVENSFNTVCLLIFPSTHKPFFFLSRCLPDEMITFEMRIPVLTVSRETWEVQKLPKRPFFFCLQNAKNHVPRMLLKYSSLFFYVLYQVYYFQKSFTHYAQ